MRRSLIKKAIDKYFGFLFKLDSASKKKIIDKLAESLNVTPKSKFDLNSIHGHGMSREALTK